MEYAIEIAKETGQNLSFTWRGCNKKDEDGKKVKGGGGGIKGKGPSRRPNSMVSQGEIGSIFFRTL